MPEKTITGYPSIDKPWKKYYTEEDINAKLPTGSMFSFLCESNKEHLNMAALNYFGKKTTFRQLITNIDKTAEAFERLGIHEGEIVALLALNTPECIVSIYALNKLGAVVDLEYINLSPQELQQELLLADVRHVLTVDMFLPTIEKVISENEAIQQVIVLPVNRSLPPIMRLLRKPHKRRHYSNHILDFDEVLKNGRENTIPMCPINGDSPALIVHTSGTTGVPKGVVLSNKNVNAIAVEYQHSLIELNAGDTVLNIAPPFVAFGICLAIHTPLCLGLQVCLSPSPDPETNGKIFMRYKPKHFLGGPAHIKNIVEVLKKTRLDLSFACTIGYGGEMISEDDSDEYVTFFRARGANISHLVPGYGMSEFGGTVVLSGDHIAKRGSVGIPLPLASLKIIDPDTGRELRTGETGEIWMTSPSLMTEYFKRPDESEKVLTIDGQGTRWMKTGDLGMIDSDGFLFLKGRLKRIYLVKGKDNSIYKLFPGYIEERLREYKPIGNCAVVVKSVDKIFYQPIAFVEVSENMQLSQEEALKYAKDHLPEYLVPQEIYILDKLPVTTTGKIDYRALEREL